MIVKIQPRLYGIHTLNPKPVDNSRKRLRIAVDVDEVLFPMMKQLSKHYAHVYKKKAPTYAPKKYKYSEHFNITETESKYLVKSFYGSKYHKSAKPILYSQQVLKQLKNKYDLGIVTGRQIYGKAATIDFINEYYYNIFDYIVCTNSYSLYGKEITKSAACKIMNVDLLIDDSIEQCNDVESNGICPILFGNYMWNQSDEQSARAFNWKDVETFL